MPDLLVSIHVSFNELLLSVSIGIFISWEPDEPPPPQDDKIKIIKAILYVFTSTY